MANQGPKRAADEPYGEALFRTFQHKERPQKALCFQNQNQHFSPIVISSTKGGPQKTALFQN
jgi:hypothetical protein